jgi:SAM-dependent methyltransferase
MILRGSTWKLVNAPGHAGSPPGVSGTFPRRRSKFSPRNFDFAISEYGACLWADPQRWVPEAGRLLRPGGQLVFLTNSFLLTLCMPPEDGVPATERLLWPAFGMYRVEWPDSSGVEFHLSHGDWIRLLRRSGFDVEDLIEMRPEMGASSRYSFVTFEWARSWPCEEVWKARKRHFTKRPAAL